MFVLEDVRARPRARRPRPTPRSPATARPARPSTACAWRNAARSRRAPFGLAIERRQASRPRTLSTSTCTALPRVLNDRIETRALKLVFDGRASRTATSSTEVADRTSPGRLRRRRRRRDAHRHAARAGPADHQSRPARSRSATLTMCPTSGARWPSSTRCATASPSARRTRRCCCGRCSQAPPSS